MCIFSMEPVGIMKCTAGSPKSLHIEAVLLGSYPSTLLGFEQMVSFLAAPKKLMALVVSMTSLSFSSRFLLIIAPKIENLVIYSGGVSCLCCFTGGSWGFCIPQAERMEDSETQPPEPENGPANIREDQQNLEITWKWRLLEISNQSLGEGGF